LSHTPNLADLNAGLAVSSQQGDILVFLAAQGLVPLFKLSSIKQSLWRSFLPGSKDIHFGGGGTTAPKSSISDEDVWEAVKPDCDDNADE
jgi:hypothetical protein